MLLRNSDPSVCDTDVYSRTVRGLHDQVATLRHGVFGVQKQIEENLLQLAGIAQNVWQSVREAWLDGDMRHLKLVLQKRQGVVNDLVNVEFLELGPAGTREIQQVVYDLRRAESLLGDLLQQRRLLFVALELFCEHLRVRGNHRQRRVHLMGNAGSEQADGRHFVSLRQLRLQLDTFGDVINDDQSSDDAELLGNEWRDGNVGDAVFT